MDLDLQQIERDVLARLAAVETAAQLAQVRADVLGRAGSLSQLLGRLGQLPAAERPAAGQAVNAIKRRISAELAAVQGRLATAADAAAQAQAQADVSLPGRRTPPGLAHPLRLIEARVHAALLPLGFTLASGPEVEHDWYNFEALGMGADHPARDMQDTFFLGPEVVLRTHTSTVQIRAMEANQPPLRILSSGMVYRRDEVDATHSPAFHQLEGLWVDSRVTFAELKGVLLRLVHHLFGAEARTRFRPSFFPFTEPSLELDVGCHACQGHSACGICRGTGWLEVLGAGMVDPAVLTAVGYDPDAVQGFAFGMGLERLALLTWGIEDIRRFYEGDLRFLAHFSCFGRGEF